MKHCSPLLLVVLALSSCATLSKNECLTGNWLTIGYEDAAEGQPPERIGAHQEACAEYSITPDFATYQQGYAKGLLLFCTPRNGFAKGKSGYAYTGICPAEVEDGFLQGYDGGREIYLQAAESSKLRDTLNSIYSRIASIDHEIDEREHMLLQEEGNRDKRKRLYRSIQDLKEEQYELERRYRRILDEKAEVDDRLDFLERRYRAYQ